MKIDVQLVNENLAHARDVEVMLFKRGDSTRRQICPTTLLSSLGFAASRNLSHVFVFDNKLLACHQHIQHIKQNTMNHVIEIVRKLLIVVICGCMGLLGVFLAVFSNSQTQVGKQDRIFGFVLLAITYVVYKVINWIFSTKDSNE
jgi:hypothetical protein